MKYDVIIAGGGPAGLSAGIYSSRSLLKTLIIEKGAPGGQILTTANIENYPGIPSSDGFSLIMNFKKQAEEFGCEIKNSEIVDIKDEGNIKKIFLKNDEVLECKALIIASGARPNLLNVPGEKKLTGKGVSYCATCDGAFFRDKEVAVIGGGNSAVEEALFLTRFVKKVYLIHRRKGFRAAPILLKRAKENEKIEFILDTVVNEFKGEESLEGISLKNKITEKEEFLKVEGVFLYVGYTPNSDPFKSVVETDPKGYIKTDKYMKTNCNGIFAAGDIREKMLRQVVTAAGDGATASFIAEKYIEELD